MENNNIYELDAEQLEEVSGGKKGESGEKVKATGDVFVRKHASKESEDIGVLYNGKTAPYLGEKKKDSRGVYFYKISFNGKNGWVSSKYSKII